MLHSDRFTMKRCFRKLLLGVGVTVIFLRILFLFITSPVPNFSDTYDTSPSFTEQPPQVCNENTSVHSFPDFAMQPQAMKDFLTYRHCKSFPQLLNSPMKCGDPARPTEVFLLLAIKSSPANYERREAIRKTWGVEQKYGGAQVRRIFLSGVPKNQQKRMKQLLTTESRTYRDIVQWDFQDTFYNLTLKQVLLHQWLENSCPGARFVFNGDDDVFVNTFNVVTYLRSQDKGGVGQHLFVGQLNIGMPPIREKNSKYYVPEELFPGDSFVPYCGGGGIIMSGFTAHSIYKESWHIPLFPIDDAYLGMCLDRAGLKPGNHEGIKTLGLSLPGSVDSFDPCFYRDMLMVHRFVPYEMLVMWKAVQVTTLECRKRNHADSKIKQS
ncbi:N-acetyllactosaminide beta-1,3-N-acetylglucosaminyltransferase 3-like isoform X1 [Ascaphus truei]|uniref:N-acetyllactosaminide beta-1,3-N-acetylglucosaminyltransferase 3-like isoform X1 n=2 Tax=Ascaphus truei TaxID=8439 RepID=UPI003F597F7D